MIYMIRSLLRGLTVAKAVEYAMVVVLVAIAVMANIASLRGALRMAFSNFLMESGR